jgi:TolA-binding protein
MRKRIVTGACLMLLMGATAYAEDAQPPNDAQAGNAQPQKVDKHKDNQHKADQPDTAQYVACQAELSRAEQRVDDKIEAKRLSEGDADQVNKLLDEADALCTEEKYAEATKTLADVDKQVSAAAKASQPSE